MREYLDRFNLRLAEFMEGRYGMDELNKFLLVVALIVMVLQLFIPVPFINIISFIFLFFLLFRIFSKNHQSRMNENTKYLSLIKGPKSFYKKIDTRWRNRKTTVYFKCSGCGCDLSVPKGKGKIRVICPKCKTEIFKKT